MKLTLILQLFLLLDVFVAGLAASSAVRHGIAHFRPPKQDPEKTRPAHSVELSATVRERLLNDAATDFKTALGRSTLKLEHDMSETAIRINRLLEQVGTEIIGHELESYRAELIQLRKQAEVDISGIKTEISKHETELKAKLAEEIEAEKQMLIKQIDTKLADAVGSFLIETLGHNVDLGAQSAYLTAMLEEHKPELVKGVTE